MVPFVKEDELTSSLVRASATFVPPLEQQERLHGNLKALAPFQHELAELIRGEDIPAGVTPTTGRDGSPTFLLSGEDERSVWFGQSSMPTISARELFGSAQADAGNGFLPGVLTGLEPLVLLEILPRYRALFVWEEKIVHLKLAMFLHNYSPAIQDRRLVFLGGEDVTVELARFFERFPGFEMPVRLYSVPQRTAAGSFRIQHRVEQAGLKIQTHQRKILGELAASIDGCEKARLNDTPRVAVITVEPASWAIEKGRQLLRALSAMGCPAGSCLPDAPDRCHVAARLAAIDAVQADVVLSMGACPSSIRALLPREMPVICWYPPGVSATAPRDFTPGPRDVFVTTTTSQWTSLKSSMSLSAHAYRSSPAADQGANVAHEPESTGRSTGRVDITVIMDVPDDRPEACGISLPSFKILFEALKTIAISRWGIGAPNSADELLAAAESQSGVHLREAAVRDEFHRLFLSHITPAAIARTFAKALMELSDSIVFWGTGWKSGTGPAIGASGPIPTGDTRLAALQRTRVAVFPHGSGRYIEFMLDALAAGVCVVRGASVERFEDEYPVLIELAPFLHFPSSVVDLRELVRRRLADQGLRHAEACKAGRMVLSRHTLPHRLADVFAVIRKGSQEHPRGRTH